MRKCTIASMNYEEFLEEFVPKAESPTESTRHRLEDALSDAKASWPPLITGIIRVLTNHHIMDPFAHASESEADISAHPGVYVDLRDCTQYNDAVPDLVEDYLDFDIFDNTLDLSTVTSEATDKGRDVAKQVMAYLATMHNRQHRLFSLFLFANAGYFRIIRMDRAGLIVSDKRLWDESDRFRDLDDLLHRFDNLSPEEQGSDSTVRPVPKEDAILEARARAALESFVPPYKRELPVLEMKVPVDSGAKSGWRSFYVWGPKRDACGICTRATLSCPAWCPREDKVFFLKDSWRPLSAEREADVIRQLNEHGVRCAPALVCGGDLPDQQTNTHVYLVDGHNVGPDRECRPRVHHRLVEHFYRPLWEFRDSKHLLQILYNACTCHREAVEKCQKLHRDLSFRNIMWDDEKQEGVLVDWDRCAQTPTPADMDKDPRLNPLAELPRKSGRPERTGTWPFISTPLLKTPGQLHTVQDDLESLFWVAFYMILLYFPSRETDLVHCIDNIFYEIDLPRYSGNEMARGGSYKGLFLKGFAYDATVYLPVSVSEVLVVWIIEYRTLINDWIQHSSSVANLRRRVDDFEKGRVIDLLGRADNVRKSLAQAELALPDLRDYEKLQNEWRSLMEIGEARGLFKSNDRLNDADHQHAPEHVLEIYRARQAAATDPRLRDTSMVNKTIIAEASRSGNGTRKSGQGTRRKRDSDELQAGSSRGTTLMGSGKLDNMKEGDTEADCARPRPTKRARKSTQSGSGRD
ncbi:hypothetical protein K523DRAFT_297509 [Schizophyllum commune Tattone D]|nr:hypothetical protein K523DRAFT_297509 [Schizophyllum commune Tattone D]